MQSQEPGTPPLGQLLVERGVLTSTQLYQVSLEERVTGKPLGEIIIERGLASPETLRDASAQSGDVAALDESKEEDADAEDSHAGTEIPEQRPHGLRGRAIRRLDDYLAAAAAELDERGEALRGRSLALEEKAARLAAAESALDERARRLREVGIPDGEAARQIDHLLQVVAARVGEIGDVTQERDLARAEVTAVQGKLAATEERVEAARGDLDAARGRMSELERNLGEKTTALAASQGEVQQLRAENAGLETSRERAETLLAKRERFVRDLAARLDDELTIVAEEAATETPTPFHADG